MNTLLKMGFIHNVEHIDSKGEFVKKEKVHNVMMNAAITNFLKTVFPLNSRCYKVFWYGFLESEYIPLKTDTIANSALQLYEIDYNETLLSTTQVASNTMVTTNVQIGKDMRSVTIGSCSYKFWGKKTLTGIALFHDYNDMFHSSITYYGMNNTLLLSAARFENPIQVYSGSVVNINSNFIMIPS